MAEEVSGLCKEAAVADYLATPSQRKKIQATLQAIGKRPSEALRLPKRYGHLIRKGLRSGFKEKGFVAKGFHGLAIADPFMTLYNIAQRPEEFKGRIGKTLGKSLGMASAIMASTRLPVLGQALAASLGRKAGGVLGGKIDPKKRRELLNYA